MLFEAVIGCGSLDICRLWLTSYWLAGPVTADPRGVAEEKSHQSHSYRPRGRLRATAGLTRRHLSATMPTIM